MAEDELLAEMHALRDRVIGITGSALASRDGLIIKADTEVNQDNLAALAATSLGLAQRMAREVGQGALREAVTRSSGGYVAIYAVGSTAVLILTGDEGLNVARLHRESRAAVDKIETMLAGAGRFRPAHSRPDSARRPAGLGSPGRVPDPVAAAHALVHFGPGQPGISAFGRRDGLFRVLPAGGEPPQPVSLPILGSPVSVPLTLVSPPQRGQLSYDSWRMSRLVLSR